MILFERYQYRLLRIICFVLILMQYRKAILYQDYYFSNELYLFIPRILEQFVSIDFI